MDVGKFLSEFRRIVSSKNGITQLRQLIYSLAVTGQLTRQMDDDDDVRLLLLNIKNKKEQLIAEKIFKGSPKLENFPLRIPENIKIPSYWRWSRLVDIGEINPKNSDLEDDTVASFLPMIGLPELHSGTLEPEERPWGRIKKGYTHFTDGDVVIAKITPCFENGKAAVISGLANRVGAGTTELHVVRPLPNLIDANYIYIFLRSPYFIADGKNKMTGTAGQKRLPLEYFATRAFPVPPIAEQKRIVAKVDELMSLCDKLDSQQQERELLCRISRQAVLDDFATAKSSEALSRAWNRVHNNFNLWLDNEDAVTDLKDAVSFLGCCGFLTETNPFYITESNIRKAPLPTGWSWKTLNQLAEYITSGSRGWKKYMASQGDIFIRSQDIKYDALIFEDRAFVNLPEQVEGMRTLVRPGDLLMTITGANVGKCAQVPQLNQKAYVSQHVALIKIEDSRNTPFLHWWITNSFGGRKHLAKYIYGDKPGLNLTQVRNIPIPLPPPEVQDRIVEALEHYKTLFDRLASQVKEAQNTAELLASAAVASITGIQIEDKEKMKVPKTELVSTLRIGVSPANSERAPLVAILIRNNGEMPAKTLWQASGMEIDAFYQQLKNEMARGWIVQPEVAYMQEMEAS